MPSYRQSQGALAAPSPHTSSARKRSILAIIAMAGLAQAAVAAPLQRRQAVPVVFQATLGNCWGNPATFGFGGTMSHNGHAPQNEDVGLAALQITFTGATAITTAQTWNVANSRTVGNVWSFETQNDQPSIGGNFQATGVTCNGGQLSTPITVTMSGKMLNGAAIAPSIVGNAAGGGGAAGGGDGGNAGNGGNAGGGGNAALQPQSPPHLHLPRFLQPPPQHQTDALVLREVVKDKAPNPRPFPSLPRRLPLWTRLRKTRPSLPLLLLLQRLVEPVLAPSPWSSKPSWATAGAPPQPCSGSAARSATTGTHLKTKT
ncbi:hypothetical protein M427DRAFT_343096 [Gonapodya prolifera JEL478]|uniref:Uncharacterized protein n=1 Tax=Gonapodya prolifera (strain JEL478) TaxID=1344416 RepID=A0A139AVH8_GONPJ|nr:hypothetical protein M427DRAFT_343096 [Gonapodya prolifera JEL478]|eukprot:KXS20709.1 hypothetical protein M427DRAFT_343096 [Gonapodya prolifera JEL478]